MTAAYASLLGSSPLVDFTDPLNKGLRGWWLAAEGSGGRVSNLMNQARFAGSLQSNAAWAADKNGRALLFDGTSSYVDLGTPPVIDQSEPFTLSWIEVVAASPPTYLGVMTFLPSNLANRFSLLRTDAATYDNFSCGQNIASARFRWPSAPTVASSVGIARHWILRGASGMTSNTATNYDLRVDGVYHGTATQTGTGFYSVQTANKNYIGTDGAGNFSKSQISNVRLWTRFLDSVELARLTANPWVGLYEDDLLLTAAAAAARYDRMLLAM